MSMTGSINEGTKSVQKDAAAVRRKSRELGEVFEQMECEQWAGLTSLLGDDKSDEAIGKLFKEIDLDSGGTIDKEELAKKFMSMAESDGKQMSQDLADSQVDKMFREAHQQKLMSSSDEITEDEFKAMMQSQIKAAAEKPKRPPRRPSREIP